MTILQSITQVLQIYMEGTRDLAKLSSELLPVILEEAKCSKGLIACRPSVQEERLSVMALEDFTPLAFPEYRLQSLLPPVTPRNVSHEEYHSLISIPLRFKNKLCGVVIVSNSSGLSNDELRAALDPLVPVTVSFVIGTALGLSEVTQAHDFFLSTVSHELRTPLSGVVGMAKLLQGAANLTKDQKEYVDIIYRCGFQLLEIINDILDYSKMDTGRMQLESVPFSVREAIEAAFEVVFLKAHEKHLQLVADVHPDVPEYIQGDRKRFRQILINLMSNAIKFTTQGKVVCRAFPGAASLVIEVEDTGVGILESDWNRIFQSFVQIRTSPLEAAEGMGLGLAISKKLVELMKGEIKVKYSKTDLATHGTCMTFSIPLQPAATLDDKAWAELSLLVSGKSILTIDGQASRRLLLAEIFTRLGMRLMMASTVQEGLLYLRTSSPDVIMVDSEMFKDPALEKSLQSHAAIVQLGGATPGPQTLTQVTQTSVANVLTLMLRPSRLIGLPTRGRAQSAASPSGKQPAMMMVLVVEDNECNIKVAVEYLYKLGYPTDKVHVASNGVAAVQACQKTAFDVILMDLKMPLMDGYQASRIILEHYKREGKSAPAIIAMTAFVLNDERQKCKEAGMKGFLPKPLLLQELEVMLEVIRKKRNFTK